MAMTDPNFRRSRYLVEKTEVASRGGLVVAQHPLAAEAGARILAAGGNAVDAAIAAAAAITVVEPAMSSLAGGGAMLIHLAEQRKNVAIEFLPRVPAGARPDMYRMREDGTAGGMFGWPLVEEDANIIGALSVAVPGTMAGLTMALERHGTLSLARLFEPAVELAEEGFIPDWYLSTMVTGAARLMRGFPETTDVFLPDGLPPAPSIRAYLATTRFRQPQLAATLRRLGTGGVEEFCRGEVGRAIVRTMDRQGGAITAQDLEAYRATYHAETAEIRYRGLTMHTLPGANGGTTAFEALNILEQFDIGSCRFMGADHLHLMACAQRAAFLDRFAHMADPARVSVPLQGLLSKDFALERARAISLDRAGPLAAGDPWPYQRSNQPQDGRQRGALRDAGCTTHLCVSDAAGNMVTLTNTLGDLWGSYTMAEGTGMLLNDGMIWFNPVPGHINSVEPGKAPLSNLTAVLGCREGRALFAIGAPGGRKVTTSVLHSIVNFVDHKRSLQEAVSAPRLHCEGAKLQIDSRVAPEVLDELARRGHALEILEESFVNANFARPVGIAVDPQTGEHRSGVDALRMAAAIGVAD